jgi:hypothetical protein
MNPNGAGRDIVGDMMNEMNLTPDRAAFLQQQSQMPMQGGGMMQMPQMPMQGGGAGMMPGMPMQMPSMQPDISGGMSPDQQLQMMQAMGSGADDETTTDVSQYQQSESEQRAHETEPESTVEMICRIGKGPLIVGLLFVIFSLKYVDDIIRQILPAFLESKEIYFLLAKAVFVGAGYMLTRVFVEDDTC